MVQTNLGSDSLKKYDISPERLTIQLFKLSGIWVPTETDYEFMVSNKESDEIAVYNSIIKQYLPNSKEKINEFISKNCKKIHETIYEFMDHPQYISPLDEDDKIQINSKLVEILNKCLLYLSLPQMSYEFFNSVLGYQVFENYDNLWEAVNKFNILCIYFYGDFYRGYNDLRIAEKIEIEKKLNMIFPTHSETKHRALFFKNRVEFDDPTIIDGYNLWVLGYLAYANIEKINENRRLLKPVIKDAIKKNISSKIQFMEHLFEFKPEIKNPRLALWAAAFDADSSPFYLRKSIDYRLILKNAAEVCSNEISEKKIDEIREIGRQNTSKYLAFTHIDIYFATSMREPVNFTTTQEFISNLTNHNELNELKLRYFDPTQSFSHDRIDKGLIECLMIKRAKVTIYNAQETDTFGKDSEAAVSLAEGKDVIVYISRMFCSHEKFRLLYNDIDTIVHKPFSGEKDFIETTVKQLSDKNYGAQDDIIQTIGASAGKSEIIKYLLITKGYELLNELDDAKITEELDFHGFTIPPNSTPSSFILRNSELGLMFENEREKDIYSETGEGLKLWALVKLIQLESRALIFQDGHPLSLQTSPTDGIARGVVITRDIKKTAEICKDMLLKSTKYQLDYTKYASLLREIKSRSVVRVVTRNENLAKSYWSTIELDKFGKNRCLWEYK